MYYLLTYAMLRQLTQEGELNLGQNFLEKNVAKLVLNSSSC